MPLIEVDRLVKVYPAEVTAVAGIDFTVESGEIFGFLGPNGAGKTTTIRILATLLAPTSGTARVDGIDVTAEPERVRRRIGYAAQFIGVDDDLTARENLVLQARLHGVSRRDAARRSGELLEVLQLSGASDRRAATFSGGMRRRLDLAQALAHEPELLFLDEPTTGLDPQTRRALWEHLRGLNDRGVTIFLTTQYLEEADALAGRLAIIDQGMLVTSGTPNDLKRAVGGESIAVTVPERIDHAAAVLREFSDGGEVQVVGDVLRLFGRGGADRVPDVVRALDAAGIRPIRVEVSEPSLDDVFLRHTGATMRVEEVKPRSRMPLRSRR